MSSGQAFLGQAFSRDSGDDIKKLPEVTTLDLSTRLERGGYLKAS